MFNKEKLKYFFGKCKRVWRVMRKPDAVEFKTVMKVSALGLFVIGAIGFIIALIMKLFF